MLSTMQDFPLTVSAMLRHARDVHPDAPVLTCRDGVVVDRSTLGATVERATRLAAGLAATGVAPGDRVASLCWNHRTHLEVFFAVPAMGAALHLVNARLSDDQLVFVVNDAADTVLIADPDLLERVRPLLPRMPLLRTVVVVGEAVEPGELSYEELLAPPGTEVDWPELGERAPAGISYTTGTTGLPKGVVYSHRSIWLNALTISGGPAMALSDRDLVLQVTPMFHVNGWGLPHAAALTGAGLVLPGRTVSPPALAAAVAATRPTVAVGVPLIWSQLAREPGVDLASLRLVVSAGSSVPPALIERYATEFGVELVQGWGMTETSPWGGVARAPGAELDDPSTPWRHWSGRLLPGVEMRAVSPEGEVVARDGVAVGELEVRGPWVTGSYLGLQGEDADQRFSPDGWLRTGDVGVINRTGFFKITDRAKDVIKSGGEWIASAALEDLLVAHPDVVEAAVIGVPDPRWDERPLAVVVTRTGADAAALRDFLFERVPRWWVPERWAFVTELPRTSVGKLDKRTLRRRHADGGALEVVDLSGA
ncbi:long-chain-fatty-acid--CoA ligase [Pseudonocardia broussonetiae]|uniref:Long-chain-fatty-acid--CoA ligase n=1 Tax=Pseudonocardia broussonetiae TaxID=2736640 RepID=A0A6M6JWW6_9PSEU|nr:long-chain-fatty-acid--CoA ligase [Pseudonocardia broussonetiae]